MPDAESISTATMPPIERQSLHELVASRLRDMIIEGELAPGDPINESRLCTELGVSRTPMREAIRTLASEGLILLRPGRSTIVRSVSPDEVRGMLEVLEEMEAMAGRLACERADDAAVREIRAVHDQMMADFRAGRRLAYYKLNQQIHTMIVAAAGNPSLSEVHGSLQARMKRIRFIGHEAPEQWHGAIAEHEQMVDALESRDAKRLEAILRTHMRNTWTRVRLSI